MPRLPFILLLALLAADAPDPIAPLITQLSSNDYQTREAATQSLAHLGESALPRLQELLPATTDAETRNRIQSAIDQISESAAAGESLITLDVTDADPAAVLAELSKQAHATISASADVLASLPKITFRCDHESLWPALRRLCTPLGLQPDALTYASALAFARRPGVLPPPPEHVLNLVKSEAWGKTPTAFAGPFLVSVQQITQTGVLVPAGSQRIHTLMIQCSVIAEPKLTVVGRQSNARVTDPDPAANPPNANIPPGMVGGGFNGGFNNFRGPFANRSYYNPTAASAWSIIVPLVLPDPNAKTLPHLKATTTAKVLVRSESWDVPDIAGVAPRSWNAAGRTFSIKSVTTTADMIEVLATATRKTDRNADPTDDLAAFNSLELLDDAGRPLPVRNRSQLPSSDPGTLTYTTQFDATAAGAPVRAGNAPTRLRWRLPVETKDVEIPIEFSDLPLP